MVITMISLGILFEIGAVLSFGLLPIPLGTKWSMEADSLIVQFFMYFPIFIGTMMMIFIGNIEFPIISYWGILGGILWAPVSILSIYSINLLGVPVAQVTWSTCSMVSSFLIGVIVFHESYNMLYVAVLGLMMMIVGTFIAVLSESFFTDRNILHNIKKVGIKWIFVPIIMGILNAVSMIPAKIDTSRFYITWFGVSAMTFGSLLILLIIVINSIIKNYSIGREQTTKSIIIGTVCGIIWVSGYYCQLYSVQYLGMSIGLTIIQISFIPGTILSKIIFCRPKGIWPMILFLLSSLLLIIPGIILLGIISNI